MGVPEGTIVFGSEEAAKQQGPITVLFAGPQAQKEIVEAVINGVVSHIDTARLPAS